MTVAEMLPVMTDRIVRRFAPLKVVLFGSQARGDARPESDVDLLVVFAELPDKRQAVDDIHQELCDLHISTDIIVASVEEVRRRGDLVGTVLRPALREGRVLYEKKGDGHVLDAAKVSEDEVLSEVGLWLVFADDDIATAELLIDRLELMPRQAGFHAQQAAEKALKAVYIFQQVQYPFSHNLDELRNGIPEGWRLKAEFPNLKALSDWAVEQRYPGAQRANTREDARRHVRQARALLDAVRRDLEAHGYRD